MQLITQEKFCPQAPAMHSPSFATWKISWRCPSVTAASILNWCYLIWHQLPRHRIRKHKIIRHQLQSTDSHAFWIFWLIYISENVGSSKRKAATPYATGKQWFTCYKQHTTTWILLQYLEVYAIRSNHVPGRPTDCRYCETVTSFTSYFSRIVHVLVISWPHLEQCQISTVY